MDDAQKDFENELMAEEDALIEEMHLEFKKRLKERIQKKIQAREQAMPETKRLKKNDPSSECYDPPSEN